MIPKYRAWHKELKQMFNVSRIDFYRSGEIQELMLVNPENEDEDLFVYPSNVEIMQWTGFTSKEDIEIYEGDIICIIFPWDAKTWIIDRNEVTNQLMLRNPYSPYEGTDLDMFYLKNFTIAGNVYANPDILNDASFEEI